MTNCKHKWRYICWYRSNGYEKHLEWCRKCGAIRISPTDASRKPQYHKPEGR